MENKANPVVDDLQTELLKAKIEYYKTMASTCNEIKALLYESLPKQNKLVDLQLKELMRQEEAHDRMMREREANMKWARDNAPNLFNFGDRVVEVNDDGPADIDPSLIVTMETNPGMIDADIRRRRRCGCDNCISFKHPCLNVV